MNANQLHHVIEESMTMIARRKAGNAISVLIMGLSLLILGVFLLVTLNVQAIIDRASDELRIYVYLKDGTPRDAARDIQVKLIRLEGVEEVVFVSKEEALSGFRASLGENKDMLDALGSNPLPDAYRVKVKPEYLRTDYMEKLSGDVGAWSGVEEVRYGERWLARGEKLVRGFYLIDLAIGFIIFLSVIFVISNTVRLTVVSRQKTIEVSKLIGATNAYIRTPFLIEGALQGAVASLLAVGLLAVIHLAAKRYLPGVLFLRGEAVVGFVVFCALLGALGSYGAMRRFLKV
jgi:cell division transport system permease protein